MPRRADADPLCRSDAKADYFDPILAVHFASKESPEMERTAANGS